MANAGLVGNSITGDSVEHHGWVATEAVELVQPHNTHSGVSCSPLNSRHYHHLLSRYTCTRHTLRDSPRPCSAKISTFEENLRDFGGGRICPSRWKDRERKFSWDVSAESEVDNVVSTHVAPSLDIRGE